MKTFICTDGTIVEAAQDDEFVAGVEAHLRRAHPEVAGRLSRTAILALARDGAAATAADGEARSPDPDRDPAVADTSAVAALEASFWGELIRPGHPSYEGARRTWNGSISRFPAVVARCTSVADVIAALRFARRTGVIVAVRGGAHSFPGLSSCDGGIVIDLSPMKAIDIDLEAGVVRAQAGVLLGELDRQTQAHGLAVPAGIVTHTGIAGLTLGGGIGWLLRKYGLAIDQLLSVELVTAAGEVVRASDEVNRDLFWGLRGAGANFGIVTEFEFRLNPLGPTVLAGPVYWPMADAPELLRFYREWIGDVPDELMTIVVLRKAAAVSFIPAELHGELVVSVTSCYAGPIEEGEKVLRPIRTFGSPVLDLCEPKAFVDHQAMFDESFPHGRWYYHRACDVDELSDDVIDITVEHSMRIRSPLTAFPVWQMGGAMARVPEDETAFDGRLAGHTFNITGVTEGAEGFDEERDWVRAFWTALRPHQTSVYVNFLMDEGRDRVREAYGAKYERLRDLKRQYDPDNVFRLNQNIPPDAAAASDDRRTPTS